MKILPCTCKSEYQDKQYGPGKRAMNSKKKTSPTSPPSYRCTVCGRETTAK